MRKFVVYPGNNPGVIKRSLTARGGWEEVSEDKANSNISNVMFIWRPTNLEIRTYAQIDDCDEYSIASLIINHFENNRGICTKTGLIRSLKHYYYHNESAIQARYSVFETIPTSFILTAGYVDQEHNNMIERFNELAKGKYSKEHVPEKHCKENMWLVKPANMNQGKGIEIFKKIQDIETFLITQPRNSYWVAQKYIEKPLLYYGRKFDIRMWVLVTHKNEIFYYRQPYVRTSSSSYSMDDFNNYVHLTNNCLQKHGDSYGKHEVGNTLPLEALQDYINENFSDLDIDLRKHLIPRMKDIIIDTIMSVKKQLNPKRRKNCFELFGYDFLIDEDFRTWLLEVNTNPYLGVPNAFIKELLPTMIDDMLTIVLDPFHPPKNPEYKRKSNEENGFELIFCEKESTFSSKPKNDRSPMYEYIYPTPKTAQPVRVIKPEKYERPEKIERNDAYNMPTTMKSEYRPEVRAETKEETESTIESKTIKTFKRFSSNISEGMLEEAGLTDSVVLVPKEKKNPQQNANGSSLDQTAKQIEYLVENYAYIDFEPLIPLVSRVLSLLLNWELHGDRDITVACSCIRAVADSRAISVLSETNHVQILIKLIDSPNVPLDIQMTIMRAILSLCQKTFEKKKVICDALIHALIKVSLASCDADIIKDYDKSVIELAIKSICALSGNYDRKKYVPGETRDLEKVRNFIISQGGLAALFVISKASVDERIKQMPQEMCFQYLAFSDWMALKKAVDSVVSKDDLNQTKTREYSVQANRNTRFLFRTSMPGASYTSSKSTDARKTQTYQSASTPQLEDINFPLALLTIKDFPISQLNSEVTVLVNKLKEENEKREREEEERRQHYLDEQKREKDEIERAAAERRKKAEQEFFRRVEEKKRIQNEAYKRIDEENRLRMQEEEIKKKIRMQELLKKKEEQIRKIRETETRRRRVDDFERRELEKTIGPSEPRKYSLNSSPGPKERFTPSVDLHSSAIQFYGKDSKLDNPIPAQRNIDLRKGSEGGYDFNPKSLMNLSPSKGMSSRPSYDSDHRPKIDLKKVYYKLNTSYGTRETHLMNDNSDKKLSTREYPYTTKNDNQEPVNLPSLMKEHVESPRRLMSEHNSKPILKLIPENEKESNVVYDKKSNTEKRRFTPIRTIISNQQKKVLKQYDAQNFSAVEPVYKEDSPTAKFAKRKNLFFPKPKDK